MRASGASRSSEGWLFWSFQGHISATVRYVWSGMPRMDRDVDSIRFLLTPKASRSRNKTILPYVHDRTCGTRTRGIWAKQKYSKTSLVLERVKVPQSHRMAGFRFPSNKTLQSSCSIEFRLGQTRMGKSRAGRTGKLSESKVETKTWLFLFMLIFYSSSQTEAVETQLFFFRSRLFFLPASIFSCQYEHCEWMAIGRMTRPISSESRPKRRSCQLLCDWLQIFLSFSKELAFLVCALHASECRNWPWSEKVCREIPFSEVALSTSKLHNWNGCFENARIVWFQTRFETGLFAELTVIDPEHAGFASNQKSI